MGATEFRCTVKGFRMLTPTVFETVFDTDQPLSFIAGQFISIVIPGAGPKGRDLRRAYSIASSPEIRPIELCVKLVEDGPGTNYLYDLKEGAEFRGFAPYGDFTFEQKPDRHALFISTGTGIAPFRAMVMSKAYQSAPPKSAKVLIGVRSEAELLYRDADLHFPGTPLIETVSQPGPDWKGLKGRVTDYIRSLPADTPWLETDYYLCGNGSMITEVKEFLTAKGVLKDSIHQEKYY